MKIVSFEVAGRASYGVLQDDGIIDFGKSLRYPSFRAALAR